MINKTKIEINWIIDNIKLNIENFLLKFLKLAVKLHKIRTIITIIK